MKTIGIAEDKQLLIFKYVTKKKQTHQINLYINIRKITKIYNNLQQLTKEFTTTKQIFFQK